MSPPRKRAPGAGRKRRLPEEGRADKTVRISITQAELDWLDAERGTLTRADYVRCRVFGYEKPS